MGAEGTMTWPLEAKKSRNVLRISFALRLLIIRYLLKLAAKWLFQPCSDLQI
jgi:hypothetical protein